MKSLLKCSLFATLYAVLMCAGTSMVYGEETPFPEVIRHEPPAKTEETTNLLAFAQSVAYQYDDAYLYRIHNDAYYHFVGVSDDGAVIQLHDTSKWNVNSNQRQLLMNWVASDDLFIKPRSSCFSPYKFVIHNRTVQQAIEVDYRRPSDNFVPNVEGVLRIVNIEPYRRWLQLSDNTIWEIDSSDSNFSYLAKGQRVIIGVNNNWRMAKNAHIIINVDAYKEFYCEGNFYGYPAYSY